MNRLQEKILEVLGERALTPKMLYAKLVGDNAAAVDAALSGLLRNGAVSLELGHYQKNRLRPKTAVAAIASTPAAAVARCSTSNVTIPSAAVSPTPIAMLGPVGRISPQAPNGEGNQLTERERAVYELVEKGWTRDSIAGKLGLARGSVDAYLCTARKKLGVKAPTAPSSKPNAAAKAPKPAPSIAVRLSVVPSPEGAKMATVGADPASKEAPKVEVGRRRNPTFSPELISRLIEHQRSKAMLVQVLCDKLSMARQDLADLEELVQVATHKDPN